VGILRNVLLSLLIVSSLSGCGGFVAKDTIQVAPKLTIPEMPTDEELGCLTVDAFSRVIIRNDELVNRVDTLNGQIDAHNKK